jgi:hypothetical protein
MAEIFSDRPGMALLIIKVQDRPNLNNELLPRPGVDAFTPAALSLRAR